MCRIGLCTQFKRNEHSNVLAILRIRGEPKEYIWSPSPLGETEMRKDVPLLIRMPHFAPLFEICLEYFTKNIPGEFWLSESDSTSVGLYRDVTISKELEKVLA
jgi:hypothetical protein